MLNTKFTLAGGIAALVLAAAAMFFAFSKIQSDPEDVSALEAATGVMLNRAQALPAARGLSEDQVIEAAVAEAVQIMEQVDGQSGMTAKQQVIYSWGPGLDRCLEAVLAEE